MNLSDDLRDWYLQIIEDRLTEDERPLGQLIPFPTRGDPGADLDVRTVSFSGDAAPTSPGVVTGSSSPCAVCGGRSCEFCRRADA